MRIHELHIKRYKNLKDFEIRFDEKEAISVLLGRNGSAKSNLIEALVEIFAQLESKKPPSFRYKLSYTCRSKDIFIDAGYTDANLNGATTTDGSLSYNQFLEGNYLPSHVFVYYSGTSDRLSKFFIPAMDSYRSDLHREQDRPLRRMFFTRGDHSSLILFCFLADDEPWSMRFLKRRFGIEKIHSARIHLRESEHSKGLKREAKVGEDRFWRTSGRVACALRALHTAGIPLRNTVRKKDGDELEDLFVFYPDAESLLALRERYQRKKDLFHALDDLFVDGFLKSIRFRLKIEGEDEPIEFSELSEGEQQLISVIGFLRFTKDQDSLFLLDEPDTHLNPLWGMEYQEMLSDAMSGEKTSQIIMATHDPMVISGMTRKSVRVMRKNKSGTHTMIEAPPPDEDPQGMGIGRILTSDMFGLRSILDNKTQAVLDKKRELLAKSELTEKDLAKLDEYNEKLRGIDVTLLATDPLYPLFVKTLVSDPDYERVEKILDDYERREEQFTLAKSAAAKLIQKLKHLG